MMRLHTVFVVVLFASCDSMDIDTGNASSIAAAKSYYEKAISTPSPAQF